MARVTAPNAEYTGTVAGVSFVDGVGQTDNANALAYFTRQGYTVDDDAADLTELFATWETTKDFGAATVAQLRAFAEQRDPAISLEGLTKKAEILAAIEAALAEDE